MRMARRARSGRFMAEHMPCRPSSDQAWLPAWWLTPY
jgi:hypothetical protein